MAEEAGPERVQLRVGWMTRSHLIATMFPVRSEARSSLESGVQAEEGRNKVQKNCRAV